MSNTPTPAETPAEPNPSRKATGVLVALAMLVGVAVAVLLVIQSGLRTSVLVVDVAADGGLTERRLISDEIIQGAQFLRPADAADAGKPHRDFSRLPIGYLSRFGPAGQALAPFDWFPGSENTFRADARLPASLVGLGATAPLNQLAVAWSEPPLAMVQMKTGTLAAYARPFQLVDLYESDAEIATLSQPEQGEARFTYVRDAQRRGARARIIAGPELESLAQGPRGFYQRLLVETARRGAETDQRLITTEALRTYLDSLAPGGVLCVHASAASKDVLQRVAEAALPLNVAMRLGADAGTTKKGHYPSDWLLLAPRPETLQRLGLERSSVQWSPVAVPRPKDGGGPVRR